ncbi:PilZ domain-containing protein [Altererythrobacter sp. SALINAS58]|uniref:PilZ domain-containing protein n=1 Tax=Alteripontixanthobacter muriae TaxID=2705546 RepID=UPI0015775322|nr:PilZ domain-containing protein [Alteripontixanthobacter muriae]NTZ43077.1 PilZ domain-containing protein [Alteripontixanthobacter muriae]
MQDAYGDYGNREGLAVQDSYQTAAQEDRCSPRTRLTIPGQLRASGGRAFQTVVHDLSISGFSAAAINRMHVGQMCWLTMPGLQSLQCEVVWWENCIVGCAFAELLSPIVHDNVLARYQVGTVYRSVS